MISNGLGEEESQQCPALPVTSSEESQQLALKKKAECSDDYQEGTGVYGSKVSDNIVVEGDTIIEQGIQEYNEEIQLDTDGTTVNNGGIVQQIQCEFYRGYCSVHKLKGKKIITTNKVWKKKKYGYGYVTSRKTTYSCMYGNTSGHTAATTVMDSDVGRIKPVVAQQGGSTLYNHANIDRDTLRNVGMSESIGAQD